MAHIQPENDVIHYRLKGIGTFSPWLTEFTFSECKDNYLLCQRVVSDIAQNLDLDDGQIIELQHLGEYKLSVELVPSYIAIPV